jgi:hypothetical protein
MSTITSAGELVSAGAAGPVARLATTLELLLVYAGVLFYIWRWQFTLPWMWMLLLAVILVSHLLHGDSLRELGLTLAGLRANASISLPLTAALGLSLLIYGSARHALVLVTPNGQAAKSFVDYGLWCLFQQYLMQSYFHNRLMRVIENRHLTSFLAAIMFAAAHIPNPILMLATTIGGFILAEIFARHRNIWPLALAQTVGGFAIAAVSPASLIHHMRVGPGYFFYKIRG